MDEGVLDLGTGGSVRVCSFSGTITGTLRIPQTAGVAYQIAGQVNIGIDRGATGTIGEAGTLEIDPGVVLFAAGMDDRLVVTRGSTIVAQGDDANPIIFTSRDDLLNLNGPDSFGQWGGVTILGRAPISSCDAGSTSNPGGMRTDCERVAPNTSQRFGGNAPSDSSGSLEFVQIRYAGADREALRLNGLGNNTTISFVQLHNGGEGGLRIDGGLVNASSVSINGTDAEAFLTRGGHQGAVQRLLITQREGTDSTAFIGGSSTPTDDLPRGNFQLSNFTFVGTSTTVEVLRLGGGADFGFFNGVVTGPSDCFRVTDEQTIQAADASIEKEGPPNFNSVVLACANPFRMSGNPNIDSQLQALFDNGSNNNVNATSTLFMGFINGMNENSVAVFDPTTVSSFFEVPDSIGAVRSEDDDTFRNWTCGLYSGPNCLGVAEAF